MDDDAPRCSCQNWYQTGWSRPFSRLNWAIGRRRGLRPEHGLGLAAGDQLGEDEGEQDDAEDDDEGLADPAEDDTRSSAASVTQIRRPRSTPAEDPRHRIGAPEPGVRSHVTASGHRRSTRASSPAQPLKRQFSGVRCPEHVLGQRPRSGPSAISVERGHRVGLADDRQLLGQVVLVRGSGVWVMLVAGCWRRWSGRSSCPSSSRHRSGRSTHRSGSSPGRRSSRRPSSPAPTCSSTRCRRSALPMTVLNDCLRQVHV